ncbi:2-C-methyl-D-erythritol 4-phosphate cytidylyltransferase [Psychrobium sp. MM17-31]|uniref:2-C-methyl-D-erythritol 4-phosphate cytidylyltransferase n=1 Tax=Psychrobium sp. MM17-31 TaxID=2917758 RepID=UPI0023B87D15|nr:2-C-methyl-D-erythritol 4-phosphate cytidylyltransferase [Psychrobium sp. MM17-31]
MLSYPIYAVVPAAGIGSRMGSEIPKQYLTINDKAIIEYTLEPLLNDTRIDSVYVALSKNDKWFSELAIASHPKLVVVEGGVERADSVLSALHAIEEDGVVLVHDAARPCLTTQDIDLLLSNASMDRGAIVGSLVRDTMKRINSNGTIENTVDRENLYHALTPQMFPLSSLKSTLKEALAQGVTVTDEASAMEWGGMQITMLNGRSDNIKVTRPEDMQLAQLFLQSQGRLNNSQENS